jgi:hypothetical protein
MKKQIIYIACVLLFIFTGSVLYGKLFAQKSPSGLTITPSNIELQVKPGESITKEIILTNSTPADVEIKVSKRNFTAQGEEGQITLTTGEDNYSLASWIETTPERINIKKDGREKFLVTIKIPKSAEPGGHFGSVVFGTVPKVDVKQTGAVVSQEIASLILVKIPGEVTEDAKIESFKALSPFYELGPVSFEARVKSNSTVHVKPVGTLTITSMFGQKLTGQVESRNILPGAIRKIPAVLGNKLLIGKYTASISLVYGTQNNAPLVATATFWAFPIRYALIVLVVLFVIYVMRRRLYKALKMVIIGK